MQHERVAPPDAQGREAAGKVFGFGKQVCIPKAGFAVVVFDENNARVGTCSREGDEPFDERVAFKNREARLGTGLA